MTSVTPLGATKDTSDTRLSSLRGEIGQLTDKQATKLVNGLMKGIHRDPAFLHSVLVESLTLIPLMADTAPEAMSILGTGLMTATRKMPEFSKAFDVCVGVAGHLATVNGHAALRIFQHLMIEAGANPEQRGAAADQAMACLPQMAVLFPKQAVALSDCMLGHIQSSTDSVRYTELMQVGINLIQPLAKLEPLSASNQVMSLFFFAKQDWQLTGNIIGQAATALPELSGEPQILRKILSKVEEKIGQRTRLAPAFVEPALIAMPRLAAASGLSASAALQAMLRVAKTDDVLQDAVVACSAENLYAIAKCRPQSAALTAFNMLATSQIAKEDACAQGFVCQEFMIVKKRPRDTDSAVIFCGAGEPVLQYAGFYGTFAQWDSYQAERFPAFSSADIESSNPLLREARKTICSGQASPGFNDAVKYFKLTPV